MDGLQSPTEPGEPSTSQSKDLVTPEISYAEPEAVSITFADLGIRTVRTTIRTVFGTVQTCRSLTATEISFLVLSGISFLLSVGLTIERLITLKKDSDDYTFAFLLLLTTVFCLYYAIDGIFFERLYEVMVCVCSTLIVMIYCILNYAFGFRDVMKLVRMILSIILGLGVMGTGTSIAVDYVKSGDLIFRTIGGNISLQRACHVLFLVSSLLGFDLQLEGSMLIFVMQNGTRLGPLEQYVLAIGVPFSLLWIIVGYLASRLENKTLSVLFLLTFWVEPAYVIFKFVTLDEFDGEILRYSIMACGTAALIVRTALIIAFVFVMRNFGKGLKEGVYGRFNK